MMMTTRWHLGIPVALLLACAEPGASEDDVAGETTDAATSDADTSTTEPDTGESDSTSAGDTTGTDSSSTTGDTTTDSDSDSTDTGTTDTGTTGDGDACASNGAGGSAGQTALASAQYPNTPGVLYVPQSYDPSQATPLMIALHGSGDTAGSFVNLWAGIAEAEGFIVLVPESLSNGASWNRGSDTPVIGALADTVAAQFNVDNCRIYLTGYSAGAHYGYMLGLANSTYFAAMGIQAGSLQYAEQAGIWPGMVERQIAVDIHHGQADPYVPFSEAQHARDELEAAGHVVDFTSHPGGHEIGPGNPQEMWTNLSTHTSLD